MNIYIIKREDKTTYSYLCINNDATNEELSTYNQNDIATLSNEISALNKLLYSKRKELNLHKEFQQILEREIKS